MKVYFKECEVCSSMYYTKRFNFVICGSPTCKKKKQELNYSLAEYIPMNIIRADLIKPLDKFIEECEVFE